jgi:luciferase family oxidoreductase group 1
MELKQYLAPPKENQRVHAVPGGGAQVPIWMLGSSLYGAQLAALLGLPFAFASHFAPAAMMQAIDIYRTRFEPSTQQERPYVMLGFNVCAAETDDEARFLRTSATQSFLKLRSGTPGRLPPPAEGLELAPGQQKMLDEMRSASAVGSAETIHETIDDFLVKTGADELIISCQIYEHSKRLRSYEIVSEVADLQSNVAA